MGEDMTPTTYVIELLGGPCDGEEIAASAEMNTTFSVRGYWYTVDWKRTARLATLDTGRYLAVYLA